MNPPPAQDEIIEFLLRPATYGIAGPVERVETHIAVVFLAGERAYKLKRAVHLPYLDFSTPELRREMCEAELALNRRIAPELYIAVTPVGRMPDGGLQLGAGEPVDWVVEMHRFDSDSLLVEVARRGELTPAMLRQLADRIARFHRSAAIGHRDDGAAHLREVIAGNRAAMMALPDALLPHPRCARLLSASEEALDRLAPLLDRRASRGLVRHCHGDLHLANICLWRGEPTPFDCLEFDAELATTDVLYDVSFLLMDLCERGYGREACLLFNRWCDRMDEGDGLATLPLFLSLRAGIRAHVAASTAATMPEGPARAERQAQALDYLAAAEGFLAPQAARMVAIGGLSGTGKSTLAGQLAPGIGRAPGARWLRSDVLRKLMAGVEPEQGLPPDAYSPENGRAVYARLAEQARVVLATGHSLVVDAVFARPEERAALEAVAVEADIPFTGIWLEAPRALRADRVEARIMDASDANAAVVGKQALYDIGDLGSWHRLDASGTPDDVAARAMALL
ncbi:MAG: AAA family ATPase [Sphingomonadales bacterium]|nr:AAA family ATPase [Sphingomonadales bacterium]MBD3772615.1 AAA family ATPase [Paracoccaceae bacterium]